MLKSIVVSIISVFITAALCSGQEQSSPVTNGDNKSAGEFERTIRPLLVKYCADCHEPGNMTGLEFLEAVTEDDLAGHRGVYAAVVEQLENHSMPPGDSEQPSDVERKIVLDWIRNTLDLKPADTDRIAQYVVAAYEDKHGNLWFGTMANGAARFDGKTLTWFSTKDGLPSTVVSSFAEDKDGNLWMGTHEGICKYDGKSFTKMWTTTGRHDQGEGWMGVRSDRAGNVWTNTNNGIFRHDGTSFSEFKLPIDKQEITTFSITPGKSSLALEDSNGNLWFRTDGYGALKFDGKSFTRFTTNDGLCSNNVNRIMEDKQGNIWFACMQSYQPEMTGDGGVCRYNGKTFTRFPEIKGLSENDIYMIYETRAGDIWIGATGVGAYRYDGKVFTLFDETDRPHWTRNFGLQAMLEDRNGTLWCGFSGGLFRFNGKSFSNVTKIGQTQEDPLSSNFKESTIGELSTRIREYYVEPDLASKVGEHLKQRLESGHFEDVSDTAGFAESLTKEVQSISKDKHLLIRPVTQPQGGRPRSTEDFLARHQAQIARDREIAGGLKEVRILDDNVGYLDLRSFPPLHVGRDYADGYMQLLSGSDAIIIDLRENGGGYPEMVQYLCSYFFKDRVHLNSLYWREGDRTQEFWSLEEVTGKKMPYVPLFVLTSARTFSGAEEFAYNMQTQKRATLIGQTTRGGANPGRIMRLNDKLEAIIPVGRAVNPITKTNWEGVGVVPDIATSSEDTLGKAHELARFAARKHGTDRKQRHGDLSVKLVDVLNSFDPETGEETVYEILKECEQAGLLGREMINGIGYEYLMNLKKPEIAAGILRANTLLFPDVPHVFDSYAEALAMNGRSDEATKNYQKAVDIAKSTNDPELKGFEEHLQRSLEQKGNK